MQKYYHAEKYVISVKFEDIDGEKLYVARVDELPDVEECADTYDMAHTLALDTIRTTQKFFNEKGMTFPPPSDNPGFHAGFMFLNPPLSPCIPD